jgi:hypothetical protein
LSATSSNRYYSDRELAAMPAANDVARIAQQFAEAEPGLTREKAIARAIEQNPELGQALRAQERRMAVFLASEAAKDRAHELEEQERVRRSYGFSEPVLTGATAELTRLADQIKTQNAGFSRERAFSEACTRRPDLANAALAEEKQRMPAVNGE